MGASTVDSVEFCLHRVGGATDPLKFSYEGNIYIETNRFLRSEPTPDLKGIENAWDNIPEFKGRTVDLKKFVDARFVNEALSEIK